MSIERVRILGCVFAVACATATMAVTVVGGEKWDGKILQYGTMREAIGQGNSQGRIPLAEVVAKAHFYGVAALAELEGEVTFFDSSPTVTGVTEARTLAPLESKDRQATLLAGAYVPSWRESAIESDVPSSGFDGTVRDAAARAGVDMSQPFVFTAEGEFREVRLHVIHGACPIHARMQKIELPAGKQPFEGEYETVRGRLVGIYAEDAVGKLTHPATSTHAHLIFKDEASGQMVTGHVERIGLSTGTLLNLPQ